MNLLNKISSLFKTDNLPPEQNLHFTTSTMERRSFITPKGEEITYWQNVKCQDTFQKEYIAQLEKNKRVFIQKLKQQAGKRN